LGEGRRRRDERGWGEEREGEGQEKAGAGGGGEDKGKKGRRGKTGPTFWVKFTSLEWWGYQSEKKLMIYLAISREYRRVGGQTDRHLATAYA